MFISHIFYFMLIGSSNLRLFDFEGEVFFGEVWFLNGFDLIRICQGFIDRRCIYVWLSFCLFSCRRFWRWLLLFLFLGRLFFCGICDWKCFFGGSGHHRYLRFWWGQWEQGDCLRSWWRQEEVVASSYWGRELSWRACQGDYLSSFYVICCCWRGVRDVFESGWWVGQVWGPLQICFLKRYLKKGGRTYQYFYIYGMIILGRISNHYSWLGFRGTACWLFSFVIWFILFVICWFFTTFCFMFLFWRFFLLYFFHLWYFDLVHVSVNQCQVVARNDWGCGEVGLGSLFLGCFVLDILSSEGR